MSFYQHNCREIQRIFKGKQVAENIETLFGNVRAFLSRIFPNNSLKVVEQIDKIRIHFQSKEMKKVSIILKQLHLRKLHCSFNLLSDENKLFIGKIFGKNHYWDFLISNIIGDLPRNMFADEHDYSLYMTIFQIIHS